MKKTILLFSVTVFTQIAQAKTIELPADTVLWRPSDLPGYQLVLQKCSACHSAHYPEYQPPNTGIAYWNAQVLRMKNVFKAPVTDEEVPIIVDYLNQTYGANRK
jgi:sulfite dehydrogenase